MTYRYIEVLREGDVIWLVLNVPEKRNAMNEGMMRELTCALETASEDATLKVGVIKGRGPQFCAGHDLPDYVQLVRERGEEATKILFRERHEQYESFFRKCIDLLWRSPVVFIAQVHGYCIVGGFMLAMACDLVIAADDARFVWRPMGGSGLMYHMMPWTIGLRKTKEILFSGDEYITGREAAKIGLINRSVPLASLEEEVDSLAKKIAKRPREFLFIDKFTTNKAFEMMGLWNACDYGIMAHFVSHMTEPSMELERTLARGEIREALKILESRGAPRGRGK